MIDVEVTQKIRRECFIAGMRAGKAHLASAFSLVEVLVSLYMGGVMRFDPKDPGWDGRDVLILSKGHGSLALYATLVEVGVLDREQLIDFCQPESVLGGEPVANMLGVEETTGSLGHGLSLGVGEALGFKLDERDNRVFVVLGDGECEEGSVWEAAMCAARYGLGNLVAIVDRNKIQKMGPVSDISGISDWAAVWKSMGWSVQEVNGHDVEELVKALKDTRSIAGEIPQVVIANTVKGKGVSLMEGSSSWHWRLPKRRELPAFLEELGITREELELCNVRI